MDVVEALERSLDASRSIRSARSQLEAARNVGGRIHERMAAMLERRVESCEGAMVEALELIEPLYGMAGCEQAAQVLQLHYVDGCPWKGVAASMGMSRRWCIAMRDKGLRALRESPRTV